MDTHDHSSTRWGSSSVSIMQHWILHNVSLNPSASIHTTVAVEFIGPLCRRSMHVALDHLVFSQPILRSVFRKEDGGLASVVGPVDRGLALLEQNVSDENEVTFLFHEEMRTRFDVFRGPLIRGRLLELSATRHFLFISAHPVVCDRASFSSMLSELRDRYEALPLSNAEERKPSITYADFARREFERLTPSVLKSQLSHWKKQLLAVPDLVQLPTDRSRPAMSRYSTQQHRCELHEELTRKLNEFSASRGISLLTALLGGWGVMMSRWSGQHDFAIGVSISNRPVGCDELIGPFENILPLRIEFSPMVTAAALLAQIEAAFCVASCHADIPMYAIDESMKSQRDGRPIIQTSISLRQRALDAVVGFDFPFRELKVGRVWEGRGESPLELSVSISPVQGRLVAVCEYAEALFDYRTIDRVFEWWLSLLTAMVNTPSKAVGRLAMLSAAERHCVINEFNPGRFAAIGLERVDAIFEGVVERAPEAPAVVDGLQVLSFAELNHRANQLARMLRRRGMHAGGVVVVPADPSVESIVAAIAVLKAGGAYVAGAPSEFRRRAVGTALRPRLYIVSSRGQMGARNGRDQIIEFDADVDEISSESTENLLRDDSTASGPACALSIDDRRGQRRRRFFEHAQVTSLLASLDERFHFARFDVWSMTHSLASRVGLIELWGALLSGSQVTIAPASVLEGTGALTQFVKHSGVTVLNQTPSEFRKWIDASPTSLQAPLHTVILTGEPIRAVTLKAWFDVGRCWPRVIYLYGADPTGVIGAWVVTRADALRISRGMLGGVPLSCCRLFILDRYREPVPIGVVGDLYVAVPDAARARRKLAQVAERVADPLAVDERSVLRRTGDRGYWTVEGRFELVFRSREGGRADIEAVRIESELLLHPQVRTASVVVERNETGDDFYVAHVEGVCEIPSAVQLRTYLESAIPAYMMPRSIVCRAPKK